MSVRNKSIQYSYPVLTPEHIDFPDSIFHVTTSGEIKNDESEYISIDMHVDLKCRGMEKLIKKGEAGVMIREFCGTTRYTNCYFVNDKNFTVKIPKNQVSGKIKISPFVVAKQKITGYKLAEFNKMFFSDKQSFTVDKFGLLAIAPPISVFLSTVYFGTPESIVSIAKGDCETPLVHLGAKRESKPFVPDAITVILPEQLYNMYMKYRSIQNKSELLYIMKSIVVLPAITDAIAQIKEWEIYDELNDHDDLSWVSVIQTALNRSFGTDSVTDILRSQKQTESGLANIILGNMECNALFNVGSLKKQ